MGIMFPFSRRLRSDGVANILFKDTFRLLADSSAKVLGDHLIHEINSEDPQGNIRFKSEWFSLLAFLITFIFQRKFLHFGKEKSNLVLDVFHDKLFTYTTKVIQDDTFPERLKARYAEYYPIMRSDFDCMKVGEILFPGMTQAFFKKIVPDKTTSPESFLFPFSFADLYSLIEDALEKIEKYEIVK